MSTESKNGNSGASSQPGPLQTPSGMSLFGNTGGASGISLGLTPRDPSRPDNGGGETGGPHTAAPEDTPVETPHLSEDGDGPDEDSPSARASERKEKRKLSKGKGKPRESGEESEVGDLTPKGTRRFTSVEDEETLRSTHRAQVTLEKSEFIQNCMDIEQEIQEDYERVEKELKAKYKREMAIARARRKEKQEIHKAKYEEGVKLLDEKLDLTVPEIKELSRKEREQARRQRGSLLSTQAERDLQFLKDIVQSPERIKALEEHKDELEALKTDIETTEAPKRSRASLGATIPVQHVQPAYTPLKLGPPQNEIPTGGYLGSMFATSTPRVTFALKPSAPLAKDRPDEQRASGSSQPAARAVGAGAPDDGGGSSSSSSSSESEKDYDRMSDREKRAYRKEQKRVAETKALIKAEEKRKKEKMEKLKLSGYRTKLPSQYDGSNDFEVYEQWKFEMDLWVENTGLDDDEAVRHAINFLKGKAGAYYMQSVATRPGEYTMDRLHKELFAWCFPPDILSRTRRQFDTVRQGERGFIEFVRELQKYQRRVDDITDKQVAHRVCVGANAYLRIEWAKAGITPEQHSLAIIEQTGVRFETAEKIKRSAEKNDKLFKPFKSTRGNESSIESNKIAYTNSSNNTKYNNNRPNGQNNSKRQFKPKPQGPKLTPQQLEEYRAAGKCFLCAEVGHSKRDCPRRNTAKPSNLSTSAISYAQIEALGAKRPELSISAVDLVDEGELAGDEDEDESLRPRMKRKPSFLIELNATRTKKINQKMEIERNSSVPKDLERKTSSALIAEVFINSKSCRALFDSGSLGDFISSTIVDQLKIKAEVLAKPIGLSMAVAGSRSQIKHCATVNIKYQKIDTEYTIDIANLDRYDLILGTPFMHRHSIVLAFNPHGIIVRSPQPLPLTGPLVKSISSCAADVYEEQLELIRTDLRKDAEKVCKKASETPLPPLRAINHRIPIIDETKTYSWRSSRCPEALWPQWTAKEKAYVASGRWEYATGRNAVPMLLIPKKSKDGELQLRTVLDKREQNANTYKSASPLPDIQEILWKVSQYPFKSLIDGKDAFEQIRIDPRDVHLSLFSTPSGTMISHVMQQGDCNATATYQTVMEHMLSHAIGIFLYVFLDDIIIFTKTLEEHVVRVKEVLAIMDKNKFFLSPNKMQFLAERLHILGHIVDSKGIQMDPHKVDSVLKWNIPNTKQQLMSFLGAVGYLAPNCAGIRIPMGTLTSRASVHKNWNWDATAQRAFDEVKEIVSKHREHHRVAISYAKDAPPINVVTDASLTGASGILSQGEDPRDAKIAMFWSGKFTPTQQNYPVHELELYAIKESLEKFKYQLYGVKFRIYTDNKSLVHLMSQKNLSPRQARWLEVINEFDFDIIHIAGEENKVADALSRMYSDEPEGMVRAESEYLKEDEDSEERMQVSHIDYDVRAPLTCPLYVGNAVVIPDEPQENSETAGEASEGVSAKEAETAVKEVADVPENQGPTLRRSGRERKPVTKYLQPQQAPRKPRTPRAKESPDTVDKGETKEEVHTSISAEDKVADKVAHAKPTAYMEQQSKGVYYDASPGLLEGIRNKYSSDNLFAKVLNNPSHFKNFDIDNGIIYIKQNSGKAICVPNIDVNGRRAREEIIKSTHEVLRHAGNRKTLYGMRGRVWWDSMVIDVKEYCQSCVICATAKTSTQSKLGLLTPLKRPEIPWERISIDFVGPLPESENLLGKWDMMLVAVDYATGMVRIIPTRQTFRSKEVAELMYENIYKLHGIPRVIVSDRDSLFTSTFWSESNRLMGIQTRLSSAYHPETDGATERANKTIGSMLRQCIKGRQSDWVRYLAGIEYAMNASVSETTGYSPFYLNFGRVPPPMVWETDNEYAGVRKFLVRQREALMRAHDAIIASRVRQTEQANKHRKPAEFKVGDLVYLSSKNMRLPPRFSRKLTPKYIGPHKIIQEITAGTTYKMELPKELSARGITPVFHASYLRIHVPNNDRKFPGRSAEQIIALDKEPKEWAVDKILTHAGKGRDAEFQILWKSGDKSWESFERIRHLEAMDAYLDAHGVDDATELKWTDPLEEDESDEERQLNEGEKEELAALGVNAIEINEMKTHTRVKSFFYKAGVCEADKDSKHTVHSHTVHITQSHFINIMYTLNPRHSASLSIAQLDECITYRNALSDYRRGRGEHPGVEPRPYQMYRAIMTTDGERDPPVDNRARTNARSIANQAGNVSDTTANAIQALLEAQEELRDALRSIAGTNPTRRPRLEVTIPQVPAGFNGTVGTSLASRIGAPTAPKALRGLQRTDNQKPLYSNKSKRFTPYARGKKARKGQWKQAQEKQLAAAAVPLPTDASTGSTSPPEAPSLIGTTETTSSEPSQSSGSSPANSDAFGHLGSAQTDPEELDWGTDVEMPDLDEGLGDF
ncbi:Transposon Ty3-I Gag-Pol polyprotein [Ceratobasidium sp. AG-Ba]|nr:Transposon Ty3-I Gag-Pol polyprotein [Ceratobasidium sp. AG-Ba]